MNYKEELIRRRTEFINKLRRDIVIGRSSTGQFDMGCFYDEKDGKWKIYEVSERNVQSIYYEFDHEEEAYKKFYERILSDVKQEEYLEELKRRNKK